MRDKGKMRPIITTPGVSSDAGIVFNFCDKTVEISQDQSAMVWKVMALCDGIKTVDDIIAESSDVNSEQIINDLFLLGILADSRKQYLQFHRISSFPTPFAHHLTQDEIRTQAEIKLKPINCGEEYKPSRPTEKLSNYRRSCRNFSGRPLSFEQILGICHAGYFCGQNSHAVPSAGALYPLRLFVIVRERQHNLPAGYYEYVGCDHAESLIRYCDTVDIEQLNYCFNDADGTFGSAVQIIITADLARQTDKYANRGYRFTLIEVGHVAELISQQCEKWELGCLELGGVLDEPMKSELGLSGEVYPILGMAIGYRAKNEKELPGRLLVIENMFREMPEDIEMPVVHSFGSDAPFFCASARFGRDENDVAGATSVSDQDAMFKAFMESCERYYSSKPHDCIVSKAVDLDGQYLNPNDYAPLTSHQCELAKVTSYADDLSISWTIGIQEYNHESVYVPEDLVYYGHQSNSNRIYCANSSGVAAHTDRQAAVSSALLELIERDAFIRVWHTMNPPKILSGSLLPVHAANRQRYWQERGRSLFLVLFPSEYATVVGALLVGDTTPCFVMGSAATDSADYSGAVHKAIQEMEYSFVCYSSSTLAAPTKEAIQTPHEHGMFYCDKRNADRLSWLTSGNLISEYNPVVRSYEELVQKLMPTVVEIHSRPGLHIIRVLSKMLVPINFGYGLTHYTHPHLEAVKPQSLELPHCFA